MKTYELFQERCGHLYPVCAVWCGWKGSHNSQWWIEVRLRDEQTEMHHVAVNLKVAKKAIARETVWPVTAVEITPERYKELLAQFGWSARKAKAA